jgi:hypothetical protein
MYAFMVRPLTAALAALVLLALPASASATEPWVCFGGIEDIRTPAIGVEYELRATCSYDPDGHDLVRYEWDLDGDGVYETDSGSNPIVFHTWTDRGAVLDGTVDVAVRITDAAGEVGEWSEPLRLIDAINAWFAFSPQLVNPGDVIDLDAFLTPAEVDGREWTYEWDLDGEPGYEHSTGLLPHASMVAPDAIGPRTIGLKVTNDLSETSVIRRNIEVVPRHPSRDHIVYEAPQNLLQTPVSQAAPPQAETPGGPPVLPASVEPATTPLPALRRARLRKVDANRYGLRLHYVRGPRWTRWRVTISIPAKRAASYGLPRKRVVFARGTVVFDRRGVGRSNRMRWTKGAYRVFRKVQRGVIDIRGKRIA